MPRDGPRSWVNGGCEGEGFVVGEERETDSLERESFGFLFCFITDFRFFFFKKTYIFNKNNLY